MMLMKMKTRTTMMSRFHNWPFKNCCRSLYFSSLLSFRAPCDSTARFNRAFRIWCTAFVILSQAPPIWHVPGGLEIHLIPLYVQNPLILCWYTHRHRSSPNSSSALVKFFPQSFRICFRRPLRLMNLLKASNIETVFSLCAASMCVARNVDQVNKQLYCFTLLSALFRFYGPKMFTPICVNKGLCGVTPFCGKFAINCGPN